MLSNLLGFRATKLDQLAEPVRVENSHLRMVKGCVIDDMVRSIERTGGVDKRLLNI